MAGVVPVLMTVVLLLARPGPAAMTHSCHPAPSRPAAAALPPRTPGAAATRRKDNMAWAHNTAMTTWLPRRRRHGRTRHAVWGEPGRRRFTGYLSLKEKTMKESTIHMTDNAVAKKQSQGTPTALHPQKGQPTKQSRRRRTESEQLPCGTDRRPHQLLSGSDGKSRTHSRHPDSPSPHRQSI